MLNKNQRRRNGNSLKGGNIRKRGPVEGKKGMRETTTYVALLKRERGGTW